MADIRFTWDSAKAKANENKHGVSFDEARTIFYDDNARFDHDPDHSDDEDRFILLGLSDKFLSDKFRVLLVCHCYRANVQQTRIISARKATKKERQQYEDYLP